MTIVENNEPTANPPADYELLETEVRITAPPATPGDPLRLEFRLDAALVGDIAAADIAVVRNGVVAAECPGDTDAVPYDPCVTSRITEPAPDGDVVIVVLTSAASTWNFAVAADGTEGDLFLSIDGSEKLPAVGGGRISVQNEDVVLYDASEDAYQLVFDGSDVGLANAEIDALAVLGDGDLVLSFQADEKVPGVGKVDDSDLVRFTGDLGSDTGGAFSVFLDGSDIGLDHADEDVDAIEVRDGDIYLSTTGAFSARSGRHRASGDDEDVFVCRQAHTGGQSACGGLDVVFDGSGARLTQGGEDVDAFSLAGARRRVLHHGVVLRAGSVRLRPRPLRLRRVLGLRRRHLPYHLPRRRTPPRREHRRHRDGVGRPAGLTPRQKMLERAGLSTGPSGIRTTRLAHPRADRAGMAADGREFSRMGRPRISVIVVCFAAMLGGIGPDAGAAGAATLWVDGAHAACSDAFSREEASAESTPWCSVTRAAAAAGAGDTVRIRPGIYTGSVRPAASGSPTAPIRYVAPDGGVTIDAGGAGAAIKVVSVSDVSFEGIAITGATTQGVWVSGTQRVGLDRLSVRGNGGPGIQIRDSAAVTVSRSAIAGNGGAGIFETIGCSDGRYLSNEITANGINGAPYSGDGIQLGGVRAHVAGNTIAGNGDPGPYEHGIYAAASAGDYLIESNVLSGNAGSDVKAAGSGGVVRYNRLGGGRLGIVFSDNATPVLAYYNVISGRYQHAVFLTTGTTAAQAKLWNNTIVVTGRSSDSGDASAVFVNSAASVDLRNNVVAYTNRDGLGAAVYVRDATQTGVFTSDHNWFSTLDKKGRHLVWNGARVTLSWWKANGLDAHSLASTPPTFDSSMRILSKNLGRKRGQDLGLVRDYAGTPVPPGTAPDIGAYQT